MTSFCRLASRLSGRSPSSLVPDPHADLSYRQLAATAVLLLVPDSSLFPDFWIEIPLRLLVDERYPRYIILNEVVNE